MFAAISLPETLTQALADRIQELGREFMAKGRVRWVPPDKLHLTLKFFGDVEPQSVSELCQTLANAVSSFVPFSLCPTALGMFPNKRRPNVLWIGIGGEVDKVMALQESVDRATQRWAPGEARLFHPHLTLARCQGPDLDLGRHLDLLSKDPRWPTFRKWTVLGVKLIRSQLSHHGAEYHLIEDFPLKKTA